jgi:hypothetical protein
MRNPDLAMQKLEKLNGKLTTMKVMITRPGTSPPINTNNSLLMQKN